MNLQKYPNLDTTPRQQLAEARDTLLRNLAVLEEERANIKSGTALDIPAAQLYDRVIARMKNDLSKLEKQLAGDN